MNKDIDELDILIQYQQKVLDSMDDGEEKIDTQFDTDILIAKRKRLQSLSDYENSWEF